jgi:hypothetical protein
MLAEREGPDTRECAHTLFCIPERAEGAHTSAMLAKREGPDPERARTLCFNEAQVLRDYGDYY